MSVRFAVLGLLAQRPRHGYELHAACEQLAGGRQTWDIKPAQIYATLGRLEQRGWVRRQALVKGSGPERHIYAVTAEGASELQRWLAAGLDPGHQHDAFFLKLGLALDLGRAHALLAIQAQRAHLCASLQAVMRQRQQADPGREMARALWLDKVAMHLQADLHWLDQVEARLDEIERQSRPEPGPRPRGRPRKAKAARWAAEIEQGERG